MIYKHAKFEDSVVMRSLEKVAQEKGLVKAEPLTKTAAAKKTDLTPTTSLLDNVLKLCSGLRERGFEKQANDLEANLVNYKVAQTMYEAFPEKGEDLIHAAHPKGSHKLEGVDAADDGAVIEDILDQHAKSVQMIEKRPTGKLSTARAISAVKTVLAQDNLNQAYDAALATLESFRSVYTSIAEMMGESADDNARYFEMLKNILEGKRVGVNENFGSSLAHMIDDLKGDLEPSYLSMSHSAFSPEQQANWGKIQKFFPTLKKYSDRFRTIVDGIAKNENVTQTSQDEAEVTKMDPEGEVSTKLTGLLARLQQYAPKVSKYNAGASFVNDESAEIKALIDKLNQEGASPALNAEVASKEKEVNDFATSWQKVLA